MRNLTLLILLITVFGIHAQETVRVVFNNESTGDYDLMIRDILNDNGYDCFVDYGDDNRASDYVIEYKDSAKDGSDELFTYDLVLFNSGGMRVSQLRKKLPYFSFGVNEPKQICKGLSVLFSKKFACKIEEEDVKYFNISFTVHKMDNQLYAIVAKGAGIRSLESVEEAFLKKASQYLDNYEYYYEDTKFKYSALGGPIPTSHSGHAVYGVIKATSADKAPGIYRLAEQPAAFTEEFDNNWY